jgi:hypothetical protein
MRRWRALLPGLVALLPLACLPGQPGQTFYRRDSLRAFHGPVAPDVIMMDVALLERPAGDAFINRELWRFTDKQVVPLEQGAILEDNGFRVGLVVGLPPTELNALLTSPRACVNPRRRFLAAGATASIKLGPTQPECRFRLRQEDGVTEVVLEQAQCAFTVVATPTADGRTRLRFTPQVEHGEMVPHYAPVPDQSGWVMEIKQQCNAYPNLAWEVTVAANDYLVIGTWIDQPDTLGHQAFVDPQSAAPVQRLLVLRTFRNGGIDADIAEPVPANQGSRSPPLALQAAWSTVRARGD